MEYNVPAIKIIQPQRSDLKLSQTFYNSATNGTTTTNTHKRSHETKCVCCEAHKEI